jgi:hypothetical protein
VVSAIVRHQVFHYFEEFEAMDVVDVVWVESFGPKKLVGAYLRNVISTVEAHSRWQIYLPRYHVPDHSQNY